MELWTASNKIIKNIKSKGSLLFIYIKYIIYFICDPRQFVFTQYGPSKPKKWIIDLDSQKESTLNLKIPKKEILSHSPLKLKVARMELLSYYLQNSNSVA
uniref:Uncharacterized protein n=1 Tax=Micrurus corallinus TaxID=54390 RepID=A0A2D4F3K8_MICCO